MAEILFFTEDVPFELPDQEKVAEWLHGIAEEENQTISTLSYIFCSDDYLLKINQNYLHHDEYTDIITFDHAGEEKEIHGDIFISIERIRENAHSYGNAFEQELMRVIVHGLLHLLGYGDKTPAEQQEMRLKEDACLSLLDK